MAVTKKGNSRTTNSQGKDNKGKGGNEFTNKYGISSINLWQPDTMLKISTRKNIKEDGDKKKHFNDLTINIYNLEDGKMIRGEDDKFDQGYFTLSGMDMIKLLIPLRKMVDAASKGKEGKVTGAIIEHINEETGNGSQLEIVRTDSGFEVAILYIEDGEVTQEWSHHLLNDQKINFYNAEGEIETATVNLDLYTILQAIESSYALVAGVGDSLIETTRGLFGSGSGKNSGGSPVNRSGRRTLGKASSDSLEEDEGDDEEEAPAPRRTAGKKSKPLTSETVTSLLAEDDDDEE